MCIRDSHPLAQVSQAHRQVASDERLALARLRGAEKDHTLVLASVSYTHLSEQRFCQYVDQRYEKDQSDKISRINGYLF